MSTNNSPRSKFTPPFYRYSLGQNNRTRNFGKSYTEVFHQRRFIWGNCIGRIPSSLRHDRIGQIEKIIFLKESDDTEWEKYLGQCMNTNKEIPSKADYQSYFARRKPSNTRMWSEDRLYLSFKIHMGAERSDDTKSLALSPGYTDTTPHFYKRVKFIRNMIGQETIIERSGIWKNGTKHQF